MMSSLEDTTLEKLENQLQIGLGRLNFNRTIGIFVPAFFLSMNVPVGHAQDTNYAPEDGSLSAKQYEFELGGGPILAAKYPGADSYIVSPFPLIAVERFFLPGIGQIGDRDTTNRKFSVYPSFNFNGERKASDSSDLTGTKKIDWALEFGLGASYRQDWLSGFIELRQGINGHTGQVADLGIDIVSNPSEQLQFTFGPRATWASGEYMQTYFGVSAAEAAAPGSVLSEFDASSGFKSVGLAARADYRLTDRTTLQLRGGWDRLIGDAARSPITKAGSEDQFTIGTGLSYRFAFDAFD